MERTLPDKQRIARVVGYIRERSDQKTRRNSSYSHSGRQLAGFNSLFATASIDVAKRHYTEFARQQQDAPPARLLKIDSVSA